MIHNRFEELNLSGSLPSPSGVGLSVLRLTQREDASSEELVWCLQADPALSGRILRLANASAGPSGVTGAGDDPCTSVPQAARRIGLRQLRNVALEFTLVTTNRSGVCEPFRYDEFWSWSIATAAAASVLAGALGDVDPAEAFTCGLLSRVGMLALASVHPDAYARILRANDGCGTRELWEAESREFGIDHREVTASLIEDWGLPDTFAGAILGGLAHDAEVAQAGEACTSAGLPTIATLAPRVATLLHSARSRDPARFAARWSDLVQLAARRGLGEEALVAICAQSAAHWKEWCELVRLPAQHEHGFQAAAAARAFPALPALSEEPHGSESASTSARPAEATPSAAVHTPVRVLVVDDDERLTRLVALHLNRAGHEVLTTHSGASALELVASRSPHIVITDWMMPGMTGLELCETLRRTESSRRTYILLLTAREDEDRIVDAFDAGADDYVTKPFNPRILLARVQAAQRLVDLQAQIHADKTVREHQVAELGLLSRKLRAAAHTDVLTELPNRRYAISRLEQEWETSLRYDRPLSVVMVDIDHFKPINDNYGHDVGDQVLRATAKTLRAFTRRGDYVCRLGGEEFLVINVNSDAQGAWMCAHRLRRAVEANHIVAEGFDGHVTVSLGVAQRDRSMTDVDALLKAADQAVYAAKAAGRNTVCLNDAPPRRADSA